jgi:pilus assembly protein CpaC
MAAALLLAAAALIANPITGQALAQTKYVDLSTPKAHYIYSPVSRSITVRVSEEMSDIVIADDKIADAQPITDRQLYIIAKSVGTTNVALYGADQQPLGVLEIEVGADLTDMAAAIKQIAPNSRIKLGSVNGKVRLGGTVSDASTLSKILEIAQQYSDNEVINAVEVEGSQQVNLEVRILEAQRNAGRNLGVSLRGNKAGSVAFGTGVAAPSAGDGSGLGVGAALGGLLSNSNPFGSLIARIIDSEINVDLMIEALESSGVVRTLAEPNLTALSGETATFNAGGEVPVRRVEDGGVVIEYKQFGVNLKFTPVVLANGLINMRLAPEVSDLNGFTAANDPIFSTRKLSTTVELRDGQSFAVGGLLSSRNRKMKEQVPWLGQVPVIGTFFRNSTTQKEETELVVIVTPRIVRPVSPDKLLATPLDKMHPSNDPEQFLLGQMEVSRAMIRKYENGEGVDGPYGHMLDDSPKKKVVYVKK